MGSGLMSLSGTMAASGITIARSIASVNVTASAIVRSPSIVVGLSCFLTGMYGFGWCHEHEVAPEVDLLSVTWDEMSFSAITTAFSGRFGSCSVSELLRAGIGGLLGMMGMFVSIRNEVLDDLCCAFRGIARLYGFEILRFADDARHSR